VKVLLPPVAETALSVPEMSQLSSTSEALSRRGSHVRAHAGRIAADEHTEADGDVFAASPVSNSPTAGVFHMAMTEQVMFDHASNPLEIESALLSNDHQSFNESARDDISAPLTEKTLLATATPRSDFSTYTLVTESDSDASPMSPGSLLMGAAADPLAAWRSAWVFLTSEAMFLHILCFALLISWVADDILWVNRVSGSAGQAAMGFPLAF
jgi:hypothetical protein